MVTLLASPAATALPLPPRLVLAPFAANPTRNACPSVTALAITAETM